jgi:ankyrin repeat protein
MELALEHNSDVNNKTKEGVAVFLQACETAKENEKACSMMLEKGADPNSKNDVSVNNMMVSLLPKHRPWKFSFRSSLFNVF